MTVCSFVYVCLVRFLSWWLGSHGTATAFQAEGLILLQDEKRFDEAKSR